MADVPIFSYNEERPIFVGRDVEGIKSLNEAMFQKYNFNKDNYVMMGDALDSMRTLDVDSPYKQKAIEEFQTEFESIINNGNFEDAGKTLDSAAQKVKRNHALQQSVSNYASYQEYIKGLKENPNGWTEREIAMITRASLERYGGVQIDSETGEAYGTFTGYDPGEKINVLAEYDEGLKNFASDKNTDFSDVFNLMSGNDINKGITVNNNEYITREDVVSYLTRYYKNDPKINKYYETLSVINSQKSPEELDFNLDSALRDLPHLNAYRSLSEEDAKVNKIEDQYDFLEYYFKETKNLDLDINQIKQDIYEPGEKGLEARRQLSAVITELDKSLDFDAAANKTAFTKTTRSLRLLEDEVNSYKFKKLNDASNYSFLLDTPALKPVNPMVDSKKPIEELDKQVESFVQSKDLIDEQIKFNEETAIQAGQARREGDKVIFNEGEYNNLNNTLRNRKSEIQSKINSTKSYKNKVEDHVQKSPEYKSLISNVESNLPEYRENVKKEITDVDKSIKYWTDKYTTAVKEGDSYGERMANNHINSLKQERKTILEEQDEIESGNYQFRRGEYTSKSAKKLIPFSKLRNARKDASKSFIEQNAISGIQYKYVPFDREIDEGIKYIDDYYSNNPASFDLRNEEGAFMDLKKYPENLITTGITQTPLDDGFDYLVMREAEYDDNGKLTSSSGTYYAKINNPTITTRWALANIENYNPSVRNAARNRLIPKGYSVDQPILMNTPVNLTKNNLNIGEFQIYAPEVSGTPDFNEARFMITLDDDFLNVINKDVSKGEQADKVIGFNDKTEMERSLDILLDYYNNKNK